MPAWEDLGFWMVHLCQLGPRVGGGESEEPCLASVSEWAGLGQGKSPELELGPQWGKGAGARLPGKREGGGSSCRGRLGGECGGRPQGWVEMRPADEEARR